MGLHKGDRAVKGHGAVHLVLEDIGVVQSVGLSVSVVTAPRIC
jgi:hypothetical protein